MCSFKEFPPSDEELEAYRNGQACYWICSYWFLHLCKCRAWKYLEFQLAQDKSLFTIFIMILLAYDLPGPASEDEKELAWQENLLIPDNLPALFSRPDMHSKMEFTCTLYLFFIIKKLYVLMMSSNSMCLSPIILIMRRNQAKCESE